MATVTLKILSETMKPLYKEKKHKEKKKIAAFKGLWEKLSQDKRISKRLAEKPPPDAGKGKKKKKGRGPDPSKTNFALVMALSFYLLIPIPSFSLHVYIEHYHRKKRFLFWYVFLTKKPNRTMTTDQ